MSAGTINGAGAKLPAFKWELNLGSILVTVLGFAGACVVNVFLFFGKVDDLQMQYENRLTKVETTQGAETAATDAFSGAMKSVWQAIQAMAHNIDGQSTQMALQSSEVNNLTAQVVSQQEALKELGTQMHNLQDAIAVIQFQVEHPQGKAGAK